MTTSIAWDRVPVVISFAEAKQMELNSDVLRTGIYTSLFIAAQIGLLAFVLCVIAQVAERYITRGRSSAGNYVDLTTRQGPEFSIFLDKSGEALLLAASKERPSATALSRRGQWQLFPEGTAMRWSASSEEGHCRIGDFGLICRCGDGVVYEGYVGQFSARKKPVFDARVDVRSDDDNERSPLAPEGPRLRGPTAVVRSMPEEIPS